MINLSSPYVNYHHVQISNCRRYNQCKHSGIQEVNERKFETTVR